MEVVRVRCNSEKVPAQLEYRFSVCTWNVNKKCSTSRWKRLYPQFDSSFTPSIYCFQEFDLHLENLDFLEQRFFDIAFLPNIHLHYRNRSGWRSGIATVTKFKAESHEPFLTHHREPLLNTPKATLISYFSIKDSDKELLLVNIHGINFVRTHRFAHQITTIREALEDFDGPVIIAGDFNTWNVRRVHCIEEMLMHLSHLELQSVGFDRHTHSVKHAPGFLHHLFGAHPLDRMYYSGKYLKLVEIEKVPSTINDEALDISDHTPLLASFELIESSL